MYPHRIHLRGPWDYEPVGIITSRDAAAAPLPPPGVMRMPCRWSDGGLPGFRGVVRFRRRFSRPARLDPHERLWLVCEGADAVSHWHLNGHYLGSHAGSFTPFEFDLTDRLAVRNEVSVEVACHEEMAEPVLRGRLGSGGGLWGTVALEVRGPVELTDLAVWATVSAQAACLRADGLLRSFRPAHPELHLLLDGAVLHQSAIPMQPGTRPFSVACDLSAVPLRRWPDALQPHVLRMELIEVGVRWHVAEFALGFRDPRLHLERAETVELNEPVREAHALVHADAHGCPLRLRLPEADGIAEEVEAQYRQILRGLSHHPSIVAWVVSGRSVDILAERLQTWDATRPVLVEPRADS